MAFEARPLHGQLNTIQDAAAATVTYGQVVPFTDYVGVYLDDAATSAQVAVGVDGLWDFPLDGADSPVEGGALFWDDTSSYLTVVETSNVYAGRCAEASTGTRVKVNLNAGQDPANN